MTNCLEGIRLSPQDESLVREFSAIALREGRHASNIISSLDENSKKSDGVSVEIHDFICDTINDMIKVLSNDLKIICQVRAEATIVIEESLLESIILNLIKNAFDAMGGQGVITTTLKDFNSGQFVNFPGLPEKQYVVVEVADTGPGIEKAVLEKIFLPRFTTKKENEGSGMGLSIIRDIMNQSGGEIYANNGSEGGAVFSLVFPKY